MCLTCLLSGFGTIQRRHKAFEIINALWNGFFSVFESHRGAAGRFDLDLKRASNVMFNISDEKGIFITAH